MIPLTFDCAFKKVFKNNLDLLKTFIILELDLGLKEEDCTITLKDSELPKENKKEYKKTIDINVTQNETIQVDIETNIKSFYSIKSINFSYQDKSVNISVELGNKANSENEKVVCQLILNKKNKDTMYGEDLIVPYSIKTNSIYANNSYILVKHLEYYRNIYYTNSGRLDEAGIWLAALTSKNFSELYEITGHILEDDKREKLLRDVISVSKDKFILHEWEKEKCDELVKFTAHENALKDGIEQGIELGTKQNKIETAKNLLKLNVSLDIITSATGLSIEEIEAIKKHKE